VRRLDLTVTVDAPAELVFDTSLQVDVHTASMAGSGERAVGGVTTGRLNLGDEVTWQARHFGRSWRMTSRITACDRATYFVDEQVAGPFVGWRHAHHFTQRPDDTTLMRDVIEYAAPYGLLGRLAEVVFLDHYMAGLIMTRNRYIATICRRTREG
jgi:ligand-binding SRPBCC domain-containing protein